MTRASELFSGGSAAIIIPGWVVEADYSSSRYYPMSLPVTWANGGSAVTNDKIVYQPFVPRFTHTFTKLAFYHSSAAESGRKFRLGLYASSNGVPTTRLFDSGENTTVASAALYEATLNQSLVKGTLYYLASIADSSLSGGRATAWATNSFVAEKAVVDLGLVSAAGVQSTAHGVYIESQAYGALPATAGTLSDGVFATSNIPMLLLKG